MRRSRLSERSRPRIDAEETDVSDPRSSAANQVIYEPRNPWQEDRDDAGVPAGWAGGAGDAGEGGALRGDTAQDADHRRLRRRAARPDGIRQAVAPHPARNRASEESGSGRRAVSARVPPRP